MLKREMRPGRWNAWKDNAAVLGLQAGLRPVQALLAVPSTLFLAALAAMLLRHPDVSF
jgi:hypothetical protein